MNLDYSPLNENNPKPVKSELTDIPKFNNLSGAIFITIVLFVVIGVISFKSLLLAPIFCFFLYKYILKSGYSVIRLSNFAVKNGFRFKSMNKSGKGIARINFEGVLGTTEYKLPVSNQIIGKYKDFDFRIFCPFTKGAFTVMQVNLKNNYAHIVLDSTINNKPLGKISRFFSEDNRINLEGDFDRHFKAYAKASAIDTLRILSPDMMQLMIDSGKEYDIEIYENKLHIIGNFKFSDEPTIRNFFDVADTLLSKLDRRAATLNASFDSNSKVS